MELRDKVIVITGEAEELGSSTAFLKEVPKEYVSRTLEAKTKQAALD